MENEEKKELTLEEMKELITVSTILPTLTTKIEGQLRELKERYNSIVMAVTSYHDEISSAISELEENMTSQTHAMNDLLKRLEIIQERINRLELVPKSPEPIEMPTNAEEVVIKPGKKKTVPEDVQRIISQLYASRGGRQKRRLTTKDLIAGFDCDEDLAGRVLKRLENVGEYNKKTEMLTFSNNNKVR